MWPNTPTEDIHASLRDLDTQLGLMHGRVRESIEQAIEYLNCGVETERTMPDVESALEMLQDAMKDLT